MRYILSPLLACGEGVGGGVLVPHNIGKCCINNKNLVVRAYFDQAQYKSSPPKVYLTLMVIRFIEFSLGYYN
jgi:hypothetical protein